MFFQVRSPDFFEHPPHPLCESEEQLCTIGVIYYYFFLWFVESANPSQAHDIELRLEHKLLFDQTEVKQKTKSLLLVDKVLQLEETSRLGYPPSPRIQISKFLLFNILGSHLEVQCSVYKLNWHTVAEQLIHIIVTVDLDLRGPQFYDPSTSGLGASIRHLVDMWMGQDLPQVLNNNGRGFDKIIGSLVYRNKNSLETAWQEFTSANPRLERSNRARYWKPFCPTVSHHGDGNGSSIGNDCGSGACAVVGPTSGAGREAESAQRQPEAHHDPALLAPNSRGSESIGSGLAPAEGGPPASEIPVAPARPTRVRSRSSRRRRNAGPPASERSIAATHDARNSDWNSWRCLNFCGHRRRSKID